MEQPQGGLLRRRDDRLGAAVPRALPQGRRGGGRRQSQV